MVKPIETWGMDEIIACLDKYDIDQIQTLFQERTFTEEQKKELKPYLSARINEYFWTEI